MLFMVPLKLHHGRQIEITFDYIGTLNDVVNHSTKE